MREHLLSISALLNIFLAGTLLLLNHQVGVLQVKVDKAIDASYVQGYERALDCRGLMSAPLCEELLKRSGQ